MKIPKKIHSFFSVFRETDRNFHAETRYVNFNRLRITSPILFVLFLGFAVYDTVSGFGPDLPRRYQNLYLYAHSGAAILLLIESLFLYIRPARAVDEVRFRHRAASTLFVLIVFFVTIVISGIGLKFSPQMITGTYTMLIFGLAVLFLLDSAKTVMLNLVAFGSFAVLVFLQVDDPSIRTGSLMNMTLLTTMALLFSHLFYFSFRKNYLHGRTIETQNADIQEMVNRIRRTETEYHQLFDNLPLGVFRTTIHGKVLAANRSLLATLGIDSIDELNKQGILKLYTDRSSRDRLWNEVQNGPVAGFETRFNRKDGSSIPVSISGHLVMDDGGTPAFLEGTIEDISSRRETEIALQESEEKFRTIVQSIPSLVTIWSQNFRCTYVSPACVRINGYTEEEFRSLDLDQIFTPESAKTVMDIFINALTREALGENRERFDIIEVEVQHKNGSIIPCENTITFLRNANGLAVGSLGVTTDITARKEAETALRESRQKLSEIIDFLPLATFVIDRDGRVTAWNRNMEEITGVKREEIVGKGDYEYALPFYGERRPILIDLVTASPEEIAGNYRNISCGDSGILQAEAFIPKLGENGIIMVGYARALYDAEGNIVGAIESIRDITEIRRVEAELKNARDDAEAATRAKSEFLANMSHEIRTPMNAIIGMTHLAQRYTTDPRQRDYLFKIDRATDNLLLIINDILDFSKIEAGKLTMEHVPFRLDEILSNLSTVVGIRAQEKGLELIFDVENGLPETLVGDPLRLNQVLVNLCGNSVKFTEKGEIILQIRCLHRVADSLRIEITVSDTGIGMSPEQMNRLFHAFTQADTSTTRKYGGTGLGLSISNRLVQMLDGSFDVQSEEGTGSTFVFTAVFGIAKTDKPRRRAAAVSFTGIRALVTDDNESARIVLCDQLESLGFTVTSAKSGTEALQIIETAHQERNPFTLVLMDWLMPGLDGLEAAKRIRSFPDFGPKIKIILATAFGNDDIFREARASGFDCFLVKPVSLSAMHDAVMNVLGKQARRRGRGVRKRDPYSAVRHIRDAKILLVEDNEMNRQVAVELLEDAGFSVTTAWNGKQAVEKMNRTFHAVLMDIQMPVMDGFEATHQIRSRREFDGIPIVAMTANAMEHDKKAALAAGMVDHVAKPIDPARLFSTLARWIKADPNKPFETPAGLIGTGEDTTVAELPDTIPGIDLNAGLGHLAGNRSAYRRLLLQFAANDHLLTDIFENLDKNNRTSAVRAAHSLKGIAGNLGANDLYLAAKDAEAALKGKVETHDILDTVKTQFTLVHDALNSWVSDTPQRKAGTSGLDPDAWSAKIFTLRALITDDDTAAVELGEELRNACPPEYREAMEEVRKALGMYDFEGALASIDAISGEGRIHDERNSDDSGSRR